MVDPFLQFCVRHVLERPQITPRIVVNRVVAPRLCLVLVIRHIVHLDGLVLTCRVLEWLNDV